MQSNPPGRTLALDVGDRRIGVAITDLLGVGVHPRPTYERTDLEADVEFIRRLAHREEVAEIVVGHPRRLDGSRSRQTEKTEAFAARLRAVVTVPVVLWDERLTSFAAEQHLESLGLDWRARRRRVDQVAAVLILEDYLTRRL